MHVAKIGLRSVATARRDNLMLHLIVLGAARPTSLPPTFRPPTLSRASLLDKSHRDLEQLHSALSSNGIVAISGIEGYAPLRVAALRARCEVKLSGLHTFEDGTTRSTQATTPNQAFDGCESGALNQFRWWAR